MIAYRARFAGSGSEYFRIWLVNNVLILLTASLYRPWAKVRRLQYFARNTRLADASLDYHGSPVAIFKGQMLVLALLLLSNLSPVTAVIAIVAGLALLPWVLQRSIGFRLRNTSYRNLRFGFDAPVRAFAPILLMTLAGMGLIVLIGLQVPEAGSTEVPRPGVLLSLVIGVVAALAPVLMLLMVMYIRLHSIGFARWGNRHFASEVTRGHYLRMLGFVCGTALVAILALGALLALSFSVFGLAGLLVAGWGVSVLAFSMLMGYKALISARLHNLAWNQTRLGQDQFSSDLSPTGFAWAAIKVFWLTVLTLGLYRPFGTVRLVRMQVESVQWHASESIEDVMAGPEGQPVSAFGQEAVDWFDIDFSL